MAKKQNKQKKQGKGVQQQLKDADLKHYIETEKYVQKVQQLYDKAIADLSALALKVEGIPEDKPFEWKHNPAVAKDVEATIQTLADRIAAVVETGSRKEWTAACVKSEQFVASIMKVSKLTQKTLQSYQDRNLAALASFTEREVEGLNLSKRVWKHVAPLAEEVELVVDTSQKYYKHGINSGKTMTKMERALGTGMSAQSLSREVRSCLLEPNKLFRRVRDKYGNLTLSKAARMYHPGQGVYRSSYKNAMRLTRTEINMAYRQSDHMRWQQLDFVSGMRIQLSNNHTVLDPHSKGTLPLHDICDILAGDYPKDFKFVGWHPQCRCFATPILRPYDEMMEAREHIDEKGYKQMPASNEVKDPPQAFNDYIAENAERIAGWKSTPYYIKDNPHWIDKALHPEKYVVQSLVLTQEQQKILDDYRMYAYNHQGSKKFAQALEDALQAQLAGDLEAFEKAMMEMDRIKSKNEASRILKAEQRAAKKIDPVELAKQKALDEDFATFTSEQQKNIRELEQKLGQKKGLRMSYEDADTGRENPHYADYTKAKAHVQDANGKWVKNPEKEKLKGYTVNCQTCTIVHELRRRGFNVEAMSNANDAVFKIYKSVGIMDSRTGKYLFDDGKPCKPYWASDWQLKKKYKVMTKARAKEFLEECTKNTGRYEIGCSWKGGGAHVFCAERRADGTLVFFDPQTGKKDVIDGYIDMAKLNQFRVLRVDNKLINPKIAATFVPKGELPIVLKTEEELRKERILAAAEKRHKARTKEKEEQLRKFAAEHKQKTEDTYKYIQETINEANGIKEANVGALVDLQNGNAGAIVTKAGVKVKTSLERMRKEADALKPIIQEFNDAMAKSKAIMSELQGISDVDMMPLLDAQAQKSIKAIKDETTKLEAIKQQLEALVYVENPIEAAKMFSVAEVLGTESAIAKKLADFDAMIPPSYWTGTKLEYKAKKLKFEAEEYLGTNKYGAQTKYKTWKISQAAYYKELDKVNKLIEAEKAQKEIDDILIWLKGNKSKKVQTLVTDATTALGAGDIALVQQKIMAAQQEMAVAEAKAVEKAWWDNTKKLLSQYQGSIDKTSPEWKIVEDLEKAIKAKKKTDVEALLLLLNPDKLEVLADKEALKLIAEFLKVTDERADKLLRPQVEALWKTLSDEEKYVLTKYTQTYCYLNEPLRNIPYVGGQTDYAKDMPTLTGAIEKSRTTQAMVVRRGTGDYPIPELGYYSLSELKVGDTFVDGAFLSTAVHKDYGFGQTYNLVIVVPKGAQGVYAEPFSHYNGALGTSGEHDYTSTKSIWNGVVNDGFGGEREWIGQRGNKFKVLKKSGRTIYLQIIEQKCDQPKTKRPGI